MDKKKIGQELWINLIILLNLLILVIYKVDEIQYLITKIIAKITLNFFL